MRARRCALSACSSSQRRRSNTNNRDKSRACEGGVALDEARIARAVKSVSAEFPFGFAPGSVKQVYPTLA